MQVEKLGNSFHEFRKKISYFFTCLELKTLQLEQQNYLQYKKIFYRIFQLTTIYLTYLHLKHLLICNRFKVSNNL